MSRNPLGITDTILRDAHQSLLATRMSTGSMLPIAAKLEEVGYHSLEMWGGATFDSAMRFLKEDPWERIRVLRDIIHKTPFQMLLRGQNIVGYKHYADDIVDKFVELAVKNGMNIFRVFDALNDTRNMAYAMQAVRKHGGHVQGTICYTISPVHSIDAFVKLGNELKEMGSDSIAVKDMAALCTPYAAFELVSRLKAEVGLPVQFHTHDTSGFSVATLLKAAEAGADVVDTAISSMAGGSGQPPTESIVATFQGTDRDTGFSLPLLADIAAYFAKVRTEQLPKFETGLSSADVRVLIYQIPGGMLSNLVSQLRQQGAENRFEEVLKEVPRVREDMGYPPLVTPTSQIVGTQAVVNVITGERYKIISKEVKDYCLGLYGHAPAPLNPDLVKKAIGNETPITGRPADLLPPGYDKAKEELGDLGHSEEDIISYALFPQQALEFFQLRKEGKVPPITEPRIFGVDKPAPAIPAQTPKTVAAPTKVKSGVSLWRVSSRLRNG
jgi:oxaloacetate decarboxylase (Na+ extruding) subunit alpha